MKKMRKVQALLAAGLLLLGGCAQEAAQSPAPTPEATADQSQTAEGLRDGTYQAAAWGNNGEITVETVIAEGKIAAVKVLDHAETTVISDKPLTELPAEIVEYQSVGVDLVSGATMTSLGVVNAVSDCLSQAGADLKEWKTEVPYPVQPVEDGECDVVVVGSGASGMTTAIYAAQGGAKVILVEKQDLLGGTSLLSNSMFGSVGTRVHKAEGKTETVEDLYENYMKKEAATGAFAQAEGARILAENSAAAAEYLLDLGVDFDHTSSKFVLAPASGKRVGEMVIPALMGQMEEKGVEVRLSTKAVKLLMEDGKAAGVEVETRDGSYAIHAKAVVLATGGYAANREMVREYLPEWGDSVYYCSPGDTGDGIRMAQDAGLEVVDLTVMKANPLVFYDHSHALTMNAAVSAGAIMVNAEGERFANEQGSYGISPIINSQTGGKGYVLFDENLIAENSTMAGYLEAGYLTEADSLTELAEKLGIDGATLEKTVERYQQLVSEGTDADFGRAKLADWYSGEKFYGIGVKPSIQGTFGGIHTNTATEVYSESGEIVPGMYAVGECAQEGVNGLNPMTVNLVFGKICGENAGAYAMAQE